MIFSLVAAAPNVTSGSMDGLLGSGAAHSNQQRYALASQRSGFSSFQPDVTLQPVLDNHMHQCGEEHAGLTHGSCVCAMASPKKNFHFLLFFPSQTQTSSLLTLTATPRWQVPGTASWHLQTWNLLTLGRQAPSTTCVPCRASTSPPKTPRWTRSQPARVQTDRPTWTAANQLNLVVHL